MAFVGNIRSYYVNDFFFGLIATGLNVEPEPGWRIKGLVTKMKLNFSVGFTFQSYPAY